MDALQPAHRLRDATALAARMTANGRDESVRDSISTVDKRGRRVWIYPKMPKGKFTQWRTRFGYVLLALLFAGPFIRIGGVAIGVEAEARIRDVQAVDRRCALKRRDGAVDLVVLVVADTNANRRILALHRVALRSSFPLDTRQVLGAFRGGRAPAASGIVVL